MITARQIFEIRANTEEDRPYIDFTDAHNVGLDWGLLNKVRAGCDVEYSVFDIRILEDDAADWDMYPVPGLLGLISDGAVSRIGRSVFDRCARLLPATVNGHIYYFIISVERLDCLNTDLSEFRYFAHDPARIMEVLHYEFHFDLIPESTFFTIPQTYSLLATGDIVAKIHDKRLRGFRCVELP